jgi:hypothetical protein
MEHKCLSSHSIWGIDKLKAKGNSSKFRTLSFQEIPLGLFQSESTSAKQLLWNIQPLERVC